MEKLQSGKRNENNFIYSLYTIFVFLCSCSCFRYGLWFDIISIKVFNAQQES